MEQKKSAEASLETKRGTRFLLGLVVVLSVLFVAFEWNSGDADYDIDETLLDDVAEELLVSTWEDKEQMVAVVEQPPKPQVSEQLKVVDVLPELPPEVEQQALATTVGEMEDLGDTKADEPLPPVTTSLDDEPLSVRVVEQLPEFPGGMSAFIQWLTKNLRYPSRAQQLKVQGKVITQFIVNKDGSVSDIEIVTSVSPDLDREALRVLRMMPKWKAGVRNGIPMKVEYELPINFKINYGGNVTG